MTPHDSHDAESLVRDLGRDLDRAIREPDPSALARQRARFVLAATTPRRTPLRWLVAPVALSAAAVAFMIVRHRTETSPATIIASVGSERVAPGQWVDAGATTLELRFSDGTRVTLSPGSHARIERLDARGAEMLLERGSAEAHVRHTAVSAWRFAAGPYSVDVTGTAFRVEWEPSAARFDLSMREGRVVLRGPRCAEGLAVRDRDEVHADVLARTLTVGPRVAVARAPALPVVSSPTPEVPILVAPSPPPSRTRVSHAVRPREDRGAHVAVAAPEVSEAEALLRQADSLRVASQGMRAREILLDVRRRFEGSASASRAAFVLGVLSLETFHAPAESARWFELYLREAPDGPLAREALGRRVQSLQQAGDDEGARAAAERYLASDSEGPFAPFARGILHR